MERLSFELLEELAKQPDIALTVITRQGTSRLGAVAFLLTSLPRTLAAARGADVVHLGDPVLALHGWLIRKLFHKPIAVTIHGLDVTYANPVYQLYLKLFGQFDLCLPISQYAQQLLKESGIRNQESRVITPGVHDRYFNPSINRDQLAKLLQKSTNYNLSPTTSVLLTTGRLVKRKGHAWFIENVLPHLPNTVYVIAGDGPEKQRLEEMAAETSPDRAESKVILLGRVSDEDLKVLYNTVDAFIQPNITVEGDAEGFGLVLLEASLCQRPVFAANLDGISAAIHNGKNGRLLPAQEAASWITALSATPQEVAPSTRAYTLANFGWPAQAQKYMAELRNTSKMALQSQS